MANIRSAEKQRRQAEKAKVRNRTVKSSLKTAIKKARKSIEGGDTKATDKELSSAFSVIDRAAKRNVIKTNTADRYKSRLTKAAKRSAS